MSPTTSSSTSTMPRRGGAPTAHEARLPTLRPIDGRTFPSLEQDRERGSLAQLPDLRRRHRVPDVSRGTGGPDPDDRRGDRSGLLGERAPWRLRRDPVDTHAGPGGDVPRRLFAASKPAAIPEEGVQLEAEPSMRMLVAVVCVVLALFASPEAWSQGYPTKPVKMVVGFPPGGGTDILARIVAQRLSDAWGQQVIVENRPGASATIAANVVAHAAPDGYTLSMGQLTPNAIAPALYPKLPYDALKDFIPLVLVGTSPNVLVVNPALPVRSVDELVRYGRSQPKAMTYASSGAGSLQHIAAELFRSMAGIELVHVPYKGSGQAVIDVMSGQVDMNFDSIPATIQHIRSGKLRAVAVTASRHADGLDDVPTIAESGLAGYDLTTWWGLFAPAGTPLDVQKRIHDDTVAILRIPEVRERFAALSVEPGGGSSAEFAEYVRVEIA